mmetsp:Transcript_42562/g.75287  ORF Transcript_42562/g.75287 Transcript_42562/m.75287 type:complete len:283 (-) Transcript_42562:2-850(-)
MAAKPSGPKLQPCRRSTTSTAGLPRGSILLEPTASSASSNGRPSAPYMKRSVLGWPMPPPSSCQVGVAITVRQAVQARIRSPTRSPAAAAAPPGSTSSTTTRGTPVPSASASPSTAPNGGKMSSLRIRLELSLCRGLKKQLSSLTLPSCFRIGTMTLYFALYSSFTCCCFAISSFFSLISCCRTCSNSSTSFLRSSAFCFKRSASLSEVKRGPKSARYPTALLTIANDSRSWKAMVCPHRTKHKMKNGFEKLNVVILIAESTRRPGYYYSQLWAIQFQLKST